MGRVNLHSYIKIKSQDLCLSVAPMLYQKINDRFQGYANICTSKEKLLVSTKGYRKYHVQIILLIQKTVNSLSERLRLFILKFGT